MLREAIICQYVRFDLGAAIHYSAMVGNGFVDAGRKLQYCDTALTITKGSVFRRRVGISVSGLSGKSPTLLFGLKRDAEAQKGLDEATPTRRYR
jgi:hypothetical protein